MSETSIHYFVCPLCGSNKITSVLNAKDYTVSQNVYEIMHCNNCTVRFTQDVPNMENIGSYYKSEQYVSHTDTDKGFINKLYHIIRERTLKKKVKIISETTRLQKGSLLDIGAGVGAFAAQAKKRGWIVTALEPDADARKVALEKFRIEAQPSHQLFQLPESSFDAITMWHVLEHVHQLHEYVDAFKKILKPSGVLIVAVPNYTSFDAQKYGEYWAAYDVPRHLYHFSPESMKKLMLQHGLEVKQMLPMVYDSYYVSMLSEKYKRGYNSYSDAFLTGLISNISTGKEVEKYSSVIYIIKKV